MQTHPRRGHARVWPFVSRDGKQSSPQTIQSTNNPAHKQSSPSEPVAQKQVRPESRCVMNFKNTVAATFVLWAQFCGSIQAAPARPNVLLIMTDNGRRHCSTHARQEIRAADFGFRVEAWITNSLYCRVTSYHSTTVRSEFRQRTLRDSAMEQTFSKKSVTESRTSGNSNRRREPRRTTICRDQVSEA